MGVYSHPWSDLAAKSPRISLCWSSQGFLATWRHGSQTSTSQCSIRRTCPSSELACSCHSIGHTSRGNNIMVCSQPWHSTGTEVCGVVWLCHSSQGSSMENRPRTARLDNTLWCRVGTNDPEIHVSFQSAQAKARPKTEISPMMRAAWTLWQKHDSRHVLSW